MNSSSTQTSFERTYLVFTIGHEPFYLFLKLFFTKQDSFYDN